MPPLIEVQQAAELMGCSTRKVLRDVQSGELRAARVSSRRHRGRARVLVDVVSLPRPAQELWLRRQQEAGFATWPRLAAPVKSTDAAAATEQPAGLSEAKLAWARSRFRVIEPLVTGAWQKSIGSTLNGIEVRSKSDYIKALATATWDKPNGKAIRYSPSGIYRLLRAFRSRGMVGLANDERSDRGASRLTLPVQDFVLAAYCSGGSPNHPALRSVAEIVRLAGEESQYRKLLYGQEAKGEQLLAYIRDRSFAEYSDGVAAQPPEFYLFPAPAPETVRRFLASVPKPLEELARRGLKRFRDKCEHTTRRDIAAVRAMQYVVFDHRRCDIFVAKKLHGYWRLVRPWETIAVDMRTRMVLATVMCLSPSALSVASCIRQVILRWGLFDTAYLDNGKEFVAQYISGRTHNEVRWRQDWGGAEFETTRGVFSRLGIGVIHARPYNPRAKLIEPSFRNPAAYERTLAGACGNRPANRPEWLSGWEKEFKDWAERGYNNNHPFHTWDQFCELKNWFYFELYNRQRHRGRGMDGRSPAQAIEEELINKSLARPVNPRALDLLMQKRQARKVGPGGTFCISWGGADFVYSAPELWLRQGESLETSYDPFDLGELNVYEPGGGYVGTARCEPLRKMGEEEFRQDIAERRRLLRQTRQAIEQIHSMVAVPTAAERVHRARALSVARGSHEPLELPAGLEPVPLDSRFENAAATRSTPRNGTTAVGDSNIAFLDS